MNPITIILLVIATLFLIRILKRGFFWKDRKGNELSFKEFMKRWKTGVQGITPLQQSKTQLMGIWITVTGIIAGIVVNALIRLNNFWWWVEIILVGSLIITGVNMISMYQKYLQHKAVDKVMRELNKKEVKKCSKKNQWIQ